MLVYQWAQTGDLLQLPPVKGQYIFSQFTNSSKRNQLLSLQLWHLFKYAKLTEVVRQKDSVFINLLNSIPIGEVEEEVENLLRSRFIHESYEKYPNSVLHTHAENEPTMLKNQTVLNDLPGEVYSIEAADKIPDGCSYPLYMIQAAQNQKQTNTGGLTKLLKLKIGAKVMLTVNIDIQD